MQTNKTCKDLSPSARVLEQASILLKIKIMIDKRKYICVVFLF